VDADRRGPTLAALWQLQHMAFTPDAQSLSLGWLDEQMREADFEIIERGELIPGMTKLIVGRKPS